MSGHQRSLTLVDICWLRDREWPIGTYSNAKCVSNLISASQSVLETVKSEKRTAYVIRGHWPQLTSDKVNRGHGLCGSHQCHIVIPLHMFLNLKHSVTARVFCFDTTERHFRQTCPWETGHRSKVMWPVWKKNQMMCQILQQEGSKNFSAIGRYLRELFI